MGLQRVRLNNTHLNITMFSQYNGSVNIIVKIRNKHPQCPGFLGGSVVKNPPASAGTVGSIPESGRSPGEENGNPLQYSCLGNPMDVGSLAGYSPWGCKRVRRDLETTQQFQPSFQLHFLKNPTCKLVHTFGKLYIIQPNLSPLAQAQ